MFSIDKSEIVYHDTGRKKEVLMERLIGPVLIILLFVSISVISWLGGDILATVLASLSILLLITTLIVFSK